MNNQIKYFILILAIFTAIAALSSPAAARDIGWAEDPMKIGIGARPMGMGRAFAAICDDGTAVFINPAGIAYQKDWSLTSMYSTLLGDVNYVTIGFTYPLPLLKNGGIAIGYVGSNVPGIISPNQDGFSYTDYHNNVLIVSSSFSLRKELAFGGSLKFFDQGFSGSTNSAGTGMDIDLGAKWLVNKRLAVGVNLQNILPSVLGGKISWPNGDEQKIPCVAKIGLKSAGDNDNLIIGADIDLQLEKSLPSTGHIGAEWRFHPDLYLRGGIDQNLSAASGGTASNVSMGIGIKFGNAKFDYAYHPYMGESGNFTHYFSLSLSGKYDAAEPPAKAAGTFAAPPAPSPAPAEEITDKNIKTKEAPPAFYKIQAGPFEDPRSAGAFKRDLENMGLPVYLFKANNQWQAQVGAFLDRILAEKFLQELKNKGFTVFSIIKN